MTTEKEWEIIRENIEAMKAAPIGLGALIKLLIDKGVITREELLDYIEKDCRKA